MKSLLPLPDLDLASLHRAEDEGSEDYRVRIYAYLGRHFAEAVDCVIFILRSYDLEFSEMRQIHDIELRRTLVERHCLPYLLTHQALFDDKLVDCRILAACVAGHTLALTHLDYHLDGAPPSPAHETTAVPVPLTSAVSYAVRMIYAAGSIAADTGMAWRLFSEVFDPISGFVISRMHADWVSRFDLQYLDKDPVLLLQRYLESPDSRLNGSGYWELMARAAYMAQSGGEVPPSLITYAKALRRLRQVVDETADIKEDLQSGLITLPTLLAMVRDTDDRVRNSIRTAWLEQADRGLKNVPEYIRDEILSTETSRNLDMICSEIVSKAAISARDIAGPMSAALEVLIWLKQAKFQTLVTDRFPCGTSLREGTVTQSCATNERRSEVVPVSS